MILTPVKSTPSRSASLLIMSSLPNVITDTIFSFDKISAAFNTLSSCDSGRTIVFLVWMIFLLFRLINLIPFFAPLF